MVAKNIHIESRGKLLQTQSKKERVFRRVCFLLLCCGSRSLYIVHIHIRTVFPSRVRLKIVLLFHCAFTTFASQHYTIYIIMIENLEN